MTPNAALNARRSSLRAGAPLAAGFYDRPAELVARDLLGTVLRCRTSDGVASGRIVETEAYLGPHDPACHAIFGRTERTWNLFGPAGVAYVYLIYGIHWCFNAVVREEGVGSAVLVRALEPLEGLPLMRARRPKARRDCDLTNGPGKLCAALGITASHDGLSLQRGSLTISEGTEVPDDDVLVTPRIGITQAAEWPLRFIARSSPYVSAAPRVIREAATSFRRGPGA
jgi:DNA-3-methyladenine glycosylase